MTSFLRVVSVVLHQNRFRCLPLAGSVIRKWGIVRSISSTHKLLLVFLLVWKRKAIVNFPLFQYFDTTKGTN